MPYRIVPLTNGSYYHIYNRGVEKRIIFNDDHDYQRFLRVLYYYQFSGPKPPFSDHHRFKVKDYSSNPKIGEVHCYCLMPNHFHILIKQVGEGGITEFMRKILNSYTKYFNVKYRRVGPLFQGGFKAVLVDNDIHLMHLSRYIHLNPYVIKLCQNVEDYKYSSYPHYCGVTSDKLCVDETVLSNFKDKADYQKFVEGHADYAKDLEIMKHLLLEEE